MDQSGSMEGEKLSPEGRRQLDDILKEFREKSKEDWWLKPRSEEKIFVDDRPLTHIFKKNISEQPEFPIKEFPREKLRERFNPSSERFKRMIADLGPEIANIITEFKLTPEQRGEALAEACHAGTTAATTVLRPITFRRGFISL